MPATKSVNVDAVLYKTVRDRARARDVTVKSEFEKLTWLGMKYESTSDVGKEERQDDK